MQKLTARQFWKTLMKTIAFVSVKGGVGKTTLCANTAVRAAKENHPVAIMDFDAQQSLKDWWEIREAEDIEFVEQPSNKVPNVISQLTDRMSYLFIDTRGTRDDDSEAVIKHSDLVVIPTKASPVDLKAIGPTIASCKHFNKPFVFVLNETKPNAVITTSAIQALSLNGQIAGIIGSRVNFTETFAAGQGVCEVTRSKSADEISSLWDTIKDRLNG